jgi:hypothetical protein
MIKGGEGGMISLSYLREQMQVVIRRWVDGLHAVLVVNAVLDDGVLAEGRVHVDGFFV